MFEMNSPFCSKEGRAERKEFRKERRAERKDKKEIRKTTKGEGVKQLNVVKTLGATLREQERLNTEKAEKRKKQLRLGIIKPLSISTIKRENLRNPNIQLLIKGVIKL